jgi:hypothetical protein
MRRLVDELEFESVLSIFAVIERWILSPFLRAMTDGRVYIQYMKNNFLTLDRNSLLLARQMRSSKTPKRPVQLHRKGGNMGICEKMRSFRTYQARCLRGVTIHRLELDWWLRIIFCLWVCLNWKTYPIVTPQLHIIGIKAYASAIFDASVICNNVNHIS